MNAGLRLGRSPAIFFCCAALAGALLALSGCEVANLEESRRLTRISELEDENARLKREIVEREQQHRDLATTIQNLRKFGPDRPLEDIVRVDRIEIEGLSGGYDDDRDGVDDGVAVYLRLYDQFGGTMRASGMARVKVFDPANAEADNVIAERSWSVKELEEEWMGRWLTSHYALRVPWPEGRRAADHNELTVLASFTDLLTGRTFTEQEPVKVSISTTGPTGDATVD